MKEPPIFRAWWTQMVGQYFHLQRHILTKAGLSISTEDGQPTEQFKVGDKVWALGKVKWKDGKKGRGQELNIEHSYLLSVYVDGRYHRHCTLNRKVKAYSGQLEGEQCHGSKTGSKYKIEAGREGTVVFIPQEAMTDSQRPLFVAWD